MNRLAATVVVAVLVGAAGSSAQAASIEMQNRSNWDIHHMFIGPAGDPDWGPDQLGKRIIPSGTSFTLTKIKCGRYDVQILDEDGDACAIYNVPLCDDKVWNITNEHLLTCQAETD